MVSVYVRGNSHSYAVIVGKILKNCLAMVRTSKDVDVLLASYSTR